MSMINTVPYKHSTIMRLYAEKDEIKLDPEYQRMGNIWGLEKKQLLIDSIINDYDIPKIYFHDLAHISNSQFHSSVIDGRQRLESIWDFMDDKFPLSDDFKYFKDDSINLKGLKYSEIAKEYPRIRINFDSVGLTIVMVQTEDIDLIEDMFSRLNEAVPLNAAERRNAIGGYMVEAIRTIVSLDFFKQKIRLKNSRFQHFEVAVKFLYMEDCIQNQAYSIDTLKPFLDKFVKKYKDKELKLVTQYKENVQNILNAISNIFDNNDSLLTKQGDMPIYYLVMKDAIAQERAKLMTRDMINNFSEKVKEINKKTPETLENDDYMYYDYYVNSLQGTNNTSSIRARVKILEEFLGVDYELSCINIKKNIAL